MIWGGPRSGTGPWGLAILAPHGLAFGNHPTGAEPSKKIWREDEERLPSQDVVHEVLVKFLEMTEYTVAKTNTGATSILLEVLLCSNTLF